MEEEKIFNEIESYIKKQEIGTKTRELQENYETLSNFWNIGRCLVEIQKGEARAKYGDELIKKWSIIYTKKYGKGYDATNLRKFRQFYLLFPKYATAWRTLSWSHFRVLLPIRDENKRNFYINLCTTKKLSVRALEKEIKNNSFERLIDKSEYIEIIQPKENYRLTSNMKNPILIELKENEKIVCEQDLELKLMSELNLFFSQLGEGFALIGNQIPLKVDNKTYYVDLLLFNYKTNNFIVVELKMRELRKEDKAQMEFYMQLVDKEIKEPFHNKTTGIIISKEADKFIASFIRSNEIIPLTYEIKNKKEAMLNEII